MMRTRQGFACAKRGAAVMLAATLTAGMIPVTALAQQGAGDTGTVAAASTGAAATGDGFYLEEGKAYPVGVTFAGEGSLSATVSSMMTRYFGSSASLVYQGGSYSLTLSFAEYSEAIGNIVCGGQTIVQSNKTYTIPMSSPKEVVAANVAIGGKMEAMFPDGIAFTMSLDTSSLPTEAPEPPAATADKSKLESAIAAAKAIEQGKKTAEAYKKLQTAIAVAETAYGKEGAGQSDIDAAVTALGQAVEVFNTSADAATDPEPGDRYGMVVGKTYTASVSYAGTGSFAGMDAMLQQMVGKYFGSAVELNLLNDGTYDVGVYFGGSTGYDDAIGDLTYDGQAVKQSANKTYTFNVPSLENAVNLALHVGGSMNMDITYAMTIDTSTIALKDGETPGVSIDKSTLQSLVDQAAALTQGKKSDAAWESLQSTLSAARAVLNNADASQDAVNEATTSLKEAIDRFNASENVAFQVGHTYEVPIAFFKQGSVTEKSMAAQYFGDTALVRPQENNTFTVSFAATTQGLEYIKSLAYQGAVISQSGDQFTLSIPATESDTVIPLDMSITMMEQLGIGQSQVADLHLYLSQAKDLGTGQTTKAASSSSSLAKTGDPLSGAATTAAGLALAGAAAVAVAARRRMTQQK